MQIENKERLPFTLLSIGHSPNQNPMTRDPGPDFNQIIWVKNGSGAFTVNGESFILEAGQGIFMRQGYPHNYNGNALHTVWCTFTVDESLLNYVLGDLSHFVFSVPDFLEKETEELTSLARSNCSALTLSAAGYSYVTEFFSHVIRPENSTVDAVRRYLRDNFAKPLTLEEVADAVGMDKFALCRLYKKEKGRTVMEELKRARIAQAKRLLRYSSFGVEEIARMCGFENHSYFSLRFKELCSCTPTEYRKKYL